MCNNPRKLFSPSSVKPQLHPLLPAAAKLAELQPYFAFHPPTPTAQPKPVVDIVFVVACAVVLIVVFVSVVVLVVVLIIVVVIIVGHNLKG